MDQPNPAKPHLGSIPRHPFIKVVSVARMQNIDRTAIKTLKIPRLLLMEHAGLSVAGVSRELLNGSDGALVSSQILVVCGTGYNGGDGMSAARHLSNWGFRLRVVVLGRLASLREEPAIYASLLKELEVPMFEVADAAELPQIEKWLEESELVIDAVLGIGVKGFVREPMAGAIERMNRSGRMIVSCDVPSGLDADSGRPQGKAIRASVTVAFGLAKQGCTIGEGPEHTGRLIVDPITIPKTLLEGA